MSYSTPTYALPTSFLGITNQDPGSDICIAGIPFDLATSNRPGTRFGPEAIRAASRTLYDGDHPVHEISPTEHLKIADVGNFVLPLGQLEKSLDKITELAAPYKHLVSLGGDHMVTFGLLRALAAKTPSLGLIQFDAHTDAYPTTFGEPWGHGSVMRRAIEHKLVDPKRMVQIGIRATVDREVRNWLVEQGVTIISSEDIHLSRPRAIAEHVRSIIGGGPCYMTFDIDGLDPSCAPGTGSPEVGGFFTWQAVSIIRQLVGLNFVGMDVMEVSPPYDHAEITAMAAAAMAYEYISLVAANKVKAKL